MLSQGSVDAATSIFILPNLSSRPPFLSLFTVFYPFIFFTKHTATFRVTFQRQFQLNWDTEANWKQQAQRDKAILNSALLSSYCVRAADDCHV